MLELHLIWSTLEFVALLLMVHRCAFRSGFYEKTGSLARLRFETQVFVNMEAPRDEALRDDFTGSLGGSTEGTGLYHRLLVK